MADNFTREAGSPGLLKAYSFDDSGNAELFHDLYARKLRYNYTEKTWYYWTDKKWAPDPGGLVENCIDELVNEIAEGTKKKRDDQPNGGAARHLAYSRTHKAKTALEKEARHLMAINAAQLDAEPFVFNSPSGLIITTSEKTRENTPEDMCSKLGGAMLAPETKDCPVWKRFLAEIFGGDEELIRFVQKALGYSMTGDVSEQCLFFLYGGGRNGKSTFLNVVSDIFGDYAMNIQPQTIMEQRSSGSGAPSPDIARLKGARFVTTVEPGEGERFNEGLIKQLTGGDKITARYLYGKEFEFKPQFKLWIAANNKPVIRGSDIGIWRRIRLIPFGVTIPEDKVDKNLPSKLKCEYPAILRWIWEGALMWKLEGLGTARKVEESTQEYRMEMDSVATFLEERTTENPAGRVKASELYAAYKHWCEEAGRLAKSATKFGLEAAKRFPKEKNHGIIMYIGLVLSVE